MNPEEIAVVAIVFGSIVTIVFLGIVGSIIKTWVKRGSEKDITENREFLSALREFKEKTDRRLRHLEAIAAGEKREKTKSMPSALKEDSSHSKQKRSIQIEIDDDAEKEGGKEGSKLRNMLNQ